MHFNIEIDTDRKIVIAKIYGIWKPENAVEYHEEYKEIVKPLLKGKWAKLTNLTNWRSSYPEIIEINGKHMRWTHDNGAVYSAFVIDNPVTSNQLKHMIDIGGIADVSKLFKTYSEADQFLKQNGF
jgi:hypothetical protein